MRPVFFIRYVFIFALAVGASLLVGCSSVDMREKTTRKQPEHSPETIQREVSNEASLRKLIVESIPDDHIARPLRSAEYPIFKPLLISWLPGYDFYEVTVFENRSKDLIFAVAVNMDKQKAYKVSGATDGLDNLNRLVREERIHPASTREYVRDCIELTQPRMVIFQVLDSFDDVYYWKRGTKKERTEERKFRNMIVAPVCDEETRTFTCYINCNWGLIKRTVKINEDFTLSFYDETISDSIGISGDPHDFQPDHE